jgi:hypothetical protein
VLLRNEVRVEIFLVVVVVVGGRVDKRVESAWMLGGWVVRGFHKWVGAGIRSGKSGWMEGVGGGVFLGAHRGLLMGGRERGGVCGEGD